MNEEIEYAEMLEIPVSTVNVVRKKRRKKKEEEQTPTLKDSVIASVNDRMEEPLPQTEPLPQEEEGNLHFEPVPDRIDTVRLYDNQGDGSNLFPYDYPLNEGGRYKTKGKKGKAGLVLGIEFGAACALCAGIFLTNVFMPGSAINTFFRAMSTLTEPTAAVKPYTDVALRPVVSELSEATLELSSSGVLSLTGDCCVYPAADGKVSEVVKETDGSYTLKINHEDSFTGVFTGLNVVYYAAGDSVKANVPVGYTDGERTVQVTMYAAGDLLNCFELTEENCLAWVSQ